MEVRLLQVIGEKLTNYLEVGLLMGISKWRLVKATNKGKEGWNSTLI